MQQNGSKNSLMESVQLQLDMDNLDEYQKNIQISRFKYQLEKFGTNLTKQLDYKKYNQVPEKKLPKIQPMQKSQSVNQLDITKQDIISVSKNLNTLLKPKTHLLTKQNSQQKIIKNQISQPKPTYKNQIILPRSMRLDPFADTPILNDYLLDMGLINIVQRGLVQRDVDIGPAFAINNPLLKSQKISMIQQQSKQKFQDFHQNSLLNENRIKRSPPIQLNQFITEVFNYQSPKKSKQEIKKVSPSKTIKPCKYITITSTIIVDDQIMLEFKHNYSYIWGIILSIVIKIQNLMKICNLQKTHLDQDKLIQLSNSLCRIKDQDLVYCLANKDMQFVFQKLIQKQNTQNVNKLVARIQALIRGKLSRNKIKSIKIQLEKEERSKYQMELFLRCVAKRILRKRKRKEITQYIFEKNQKLSQHWNNIKQQKRVEIHINSSSYTEFQRETILKFNQKKNMQISRLFSLTDPNLEIIYVLPFDITDEIIKYYYKVLEMGHVQNYKQRLHFIYPENQLFFPNSYSLTRCLIYSPNAIKEIKRICKSKIAYMVPAKTNWDENYLAYEIDVPLLCGDPLRANELSLQSQGKLLLEQAGLPVFPGIFIEKQVETLETLISKLSFCILQNPIQSKWIFKIDNEHQSRGLAYFEFDLKILAKNLQMTVGKLVQEREKSIVLIHNIIKDQLGGKLFICCQNLYKDFNEFIDTFLEQGGIIEAFALTDTSQSISQNSSIVLFIEPNGESNIRMTYDKLQTDRHQSYGIQYPQKSLPNIDLEQIRSKVTDLIFKQNVFGYVVIDFITFPCLIDPLGNNLFCAIGLDCYLNDFTTSLFYYNFLLSDRQFINRMDQSFTKSNDNIQDFSQPILQPYYMYIPFLHHPGIGTVNQQKFFLECRQSNISFDLQKKEGSTFIIVDQLKSGVISLMSMGASFNHPLRFITDSLNFLLFMFGNIKFQKGDIENNRNDKLHFMDITLKSRIINSQYKDQF